MLRAGNVMIVKLNCFYTCYRAVNAFEYAYDQWRFRGTEASRVKSAGEDNNKPREALPVESETTLNFAEVRATREDSNASEVVLPPPIRTGTGTLLGPDEDSSTEADR